MSAMMLTFMGLGLLLGVGASFIAARLLRVDHLWSMPVTFDPQRIQRDLCTLVERYSAEGSSQASPSQSGPQGVHPRESLIALSMTIEHPLLNRAVALLRVNTPADELQSILLAHAAKAEQLDARAHFWGRLLSAAAPGLALAGLAGAMILALRTATTATPSASSASAMLFLVICAMLLSTTSKLSPKSTQSDLPGAIVINSAIILTATALARNEPASAIIGQIKATLAPAASGLFDDLYPAKAA